MHNNPFRLYEKQAFTYPLSFMGIFLQSSYSSICLVVFLIFLIFA